MAFLAATVLLSVPAACLVTRMYGRLSMIQPASIERCNEWRFTVCNDERGSSSNVSVRTRPQTSRPLCVAAASTQSPSRGICRALRSSRAKPPTGSDLSMTACRSPRRRRGRPTGYRSIWRSTSCWATRRRIWSSARCESMKKLRSGPTCGP